MTNHDLSVWLERVGSGYSVRFSEAFNEAGIETVDDLLAVAKDHDLVEALLAKLNRAGARPIQMVIIERAVLQSLPKKS